MSSSRPRPPSVAPSRCRRTILARAARVRLMAVESGRSVPRAADLGRPDIEVRTRVDETMMRAVAVFVGRAVRGGMPVTTRRARRATPHARCGVPGEHAGIR